MEFETILLDKKDQIATITFNRPDKMNAASPAVFSDLDAALTDIEKDDDIRVVILTGKGEAFSAGRIQTSPTHLAGQQLQFYTGSGLFQARS